MVIKKKIILLLMLGLCIGFCFFALQKDWIIIRLPFAAQQEHPLEINVEKRATKLFYWQHEAWHHETVETIWSNKKAATIKRLLDSWLTFMDEERLMSKKVSLQSVILSPSEKDAYLSFDRYPFWPESSTAEKFMWLEALLKTLRDNGIQLQGVRFLVHHQEMVDAHLDFSNPWPGIGFLK